MAPETLVTSLISENRELARILSASIMIALPKAHNKQMTIREGYTQGAGGPRVFFRLRGAHLRRLQSYTQTLLNVMTSRESTARPFWLAGLQRADSIMPANSLSNESSSGYSSTF